jgi:hypothetical protein
LPDTGATRDISMRSKLDGSLALGDHSSVQSKVIRGRTCDQPMT